MQVWTIMALAIRLPMGEPSKEQGGEETGAVKTAGRVLRQTWAMPSSFAPPSGLPAISPSRGEIICAYGVATLEIWRRQR
ncbi:hypothetical protein X730_14215 [Mesorhizobium sp. L103C565B0]|nr:hypothetical protein X730_14215 [Mesorhizobium sp. L103C565B0]